MAKIKVSALPQITSSLQITSEDLFIVNDGTTTKNITAELLSTKIGSGYTNTGAFKGKPLDNSYVWEAGEGIRYTTSDSENGVWKVFSLDEAVHNAVDQPYWSVPDVSGLPNVGLFNGYALPIGVDTMFDYSSSFDTKYPTVNDFAANPASAGSQTSFGYFQGSDGRINLSGLQYGDQIRVRFAFNAIPQVANTTLEPALWYSNRNADDKETFSFPLTTSPVFFGQGTPGQTILNRVELSAWVISDEDVNALTLPAIKSNNPITIQPLDILITVIR